ncbi:PAS domain-containing sensor histidine kinase [uncultured Clostridium sp.]|uniref:sensor histidine kinase n=1 Tax=uncultured Clostridium sp. TaxID=59620 RepID=UPI0025E56F65|nr:PAS domain-containing sensor histidine kinase [uncultured Clostridium sp.]
MAESTRLYKNNREYTIEDLEEILDMLPYQIWLKDSEGRHIYTNKLFAESVGLSKEDIAGKTDYEIRDSDTAKLCIETDKRLSNKDIHIYNEEHVNVDNDDRYFRVNKFKLLRHTDKGQIIGGIAEEISLEKNIQLELEDNLLNLLGSGKTEQESRQFLESIIKSLKKTIKCKDIEAFLYNKEEKKFSLYLSLNKENKSFEENQDIFINEEIENNLISNDFVEDRYADIYEKIIEVQKNNKEDKLKIKHVKLANELFGLVCIYYNNDEIISIDEVFLDEVFTKIGIILKQIENKVQVLSIKEKKKELENIIELGNIKTDFFDNISHEFRTPINVILLTIQLLSSDSEIKNLIDRHKKYLNTLKENSYRLLRLVNNNIDVAQINNNCYELKMKNQDIISMIEDITMYSVKFAEERKRNIIFDTDEEELIIACDSDKIEKIMLNLISNAIKFSNEDSDIHVDIKTNFNEKKVFISVRNYGETIGEDNKEFIFGKSTQLDNLFIRRSEGSGLGLFITKKFVEMHNGSIFVDSIENYTHFTFCIPIHTIDGQDIYIRKSDENKMIEKCNIEFSDIYI